VTTTQLKRLRKDDLVELVRTLAADLKAATPNRNDERARHLLAAVFGGVLTALVFSGSQGQP
jgi:hypothetical protein